MTNERYQIVRFHFDADNEVIDTGLTLAEAQAHCQRDDTKHVTTYRDDAGEVVDQVTDWFDGYEVMS